MHVLIVDAHPVTRLGLRTLLRERWPGAAVTEAGSIGAALDALRTLVPPSLVLQDLRLPDAVGVDGVARTLRASREARLLVVTDSDEAVYASRVMRMGAAGFVSKQRALADLVTAMERVLAGGRYVSPEQAERLLAHLGSPTGPGLPHEQLSAQELRVLQLIAAGRAPAEIARTMSLSVKTVGSYRARLMAKSGWTSTAAMSRYCLLHGLIDPD